MSNCIIERPVKNGMVLIALGKRRTETSPILLFGKQEFDAADKEAIEAYKEELYASLNTDDSESSCPPVGNGKRKNNAHLANLM